MKKEKLLITGGFGYLGSVLVEQLIQRAEELNIEKITILDSLLFKESSPLPLLRSPLVDIVIGDVRNKKLLPELVTSHSTVIPLAALVGAPICAKYEKEAWEVNTGQIETILAAARPDTKILLATTNSLYGDTGGKVDETSEVRCISVYAQSKYKSEQIVLARGGVSMRLSTLCGVSYKQRLDLLVNTFCLKSLTDKYIVIYEPGFMRCYISVKDAARAFIHAFKNYDTFKGQIFNVGNTKLNCNKLQLAEEVKRYVPEFVIKVDDYHVDPDQRDYEVSNKKLESTNFQCQDDFDVIIPQVLKAYRVLLETKNYMLT